MAQHWHYFQHVPSGETYAIMIGDNGEFKEVSDSIYYEDIKVENLLLGFDFDPDDQEWMGSQTWHLVGPANPVCDCDAELVRDYPGLRQD